MDKKNFILFEEKFSKLDEIHYFKAPARINIIGEHVDYLGGLVLPAAIDFYVEILVQKNHSNKFRFYSVQYKEEFETIELIHQKNKQWTNYILGVISEFEKLNHKVSGLDILIDGNIPQGSGLSSSAALEVVVGFAIKEIFNFNVSLEKIALIGQSAENNFVGTKCGIMDQYIIANGKKDKCLLLNTATLEKTYHELELENFEFYLINSNVKHSLHDSDYNLRREECESALKKIKDKQPTLQNLYELDEVPDYLNETETKRVRHVVGEKKRTQAILGYFRNKSLEQAASILYEAHDSLSNLFEVSCGEIDFLIEELKKVNVSGARMIGGGFGGCILVLDQKGNKEKIIKDLKQCYLEKFSLVLEIYSFQISEGVTKVLQGLI